jgi:hypothetical protein
MFTLEGYIWTQVMKPQERPQLSTTLLMSVSSMGCVTFSV